MGSVWIVRCYNLARIIFVVFGIHDTHLHFRYYIYKFTIILSIIFKRATFFKLIMVFLIDKRSIMEIKVFYHQTKIDYCFRLCFN